MINTPYDLKYRPKILKRFLGQPNAVAQIRGFLKNTNIPPRILITGNTGTGKTTLARIIANKLNNSDEDTIEINVSDKRSIEDIRDLVKIIRFKPKHKYKVIILDEVQGIQKLSSNAFLKALEEPPPHIIWILCTNEPEALLPTIKNRCELIALEHIPPNIIIDNLLYIAGKEQLKIPPKSLMLACKYIAINSNGSIRDSINQFSAFVNRYSSNPKFKIDDSTFKSILLKTESPLDDLAVEFLVNVYKNNIASLIKLALINKDQLVSILFRTMLLNRFIVEELSGAANRRFIPLYKKFQSQIAKPNIKFSVLIHNKLIFVKKELLTKPIDEDSIICALSHL